MDDDGGGGAAPPAAPHDALTNIFALRGLERARFRVYRIRSAIDRPQLYKSSHALAERIRYLESGVGLEIAAVAAAVAMVNASGRTVAAPRGRDRAADHDDPGDHSRTFLWIFCAVDHADQLLDHWHQKLAPLFDMVRQGDWDGARPAAHPDATVALLSAAREFITCSLMRKGYVRLKDEVVMPEPAASSAALAGQATQLSVVAAAAAAVPSAIAFQVVPYVTAGQPESMAVRVGTRKVPMLGITIADLESGIHLPVVLCPHGTPATLIPAKVAGDGLAANVLNRWREAGLIPDDPLCPDYDHTESRSVVYVRESASGMEMPVPRRCVLKRISPDQPPVSEANSTPKPFLAFGKDLPIPSPTEMIWQARKRPRSPPLSSTGPPESPAEPESVPEIDATKAPANDSAGASLLSPANGKGRLPDDARMHDGDGKPARGNRSTPKSASKDHGYDDISKLSELGELDEFDKFFGGGDKGDKTKKKQPNLSGSLPLATKRPEDMDIETKLRTADKRRERPGANFALPPSALDPAKQAQELQRFYEQDRRARIPKTVAVWRDKQRAYGQGTSTVKRSLRPDGITKRNVGGLKARQTLRGLYVPMRQVQKFLSKRQGAPHNGVIENSPVDDPDSSSDQDDDGDESDVKSDDGDIESTLPASTSAITPPVAIDCTSACGALRLSDRLVTELDSLASRGEPSKPHLAGTGDRAQFASILALIDMQVLGTANMWLKRPHSGPSLEKREDSKGPEIRKSLYTFPRILQDACSHRDGIPLSVTGPLAVSRVISPVKQLASPRVCVGYTDNWVETRTSVLPLWEKVGLKPFSGRKDVVYYVIAPREKAAKIETFFRDLQTAYEECSFGSHKHKSTTLVGDVERAASCAAGSQEESNLLARYSTAVAGLATNLNAPRGPEEHVHKIVYVVSPFASSQSTSNSAFFKRLTPLVNLKGHGASGRGAAPWRSPSSDGTGMIPIIKVLCPDFLGLSPPNHGPSAVLRPQLVKAFASSVYNSIRGKPLRGVVEPAHARLNPGPLAVGEVMSPVTPEQAIASPGAAIAPNVAKTANAETPDERAVVRGASVLFEPFAVLPGVGEHIGEYSVSGSEREMVFHICFSFSEKAGRYICALTDSRGESLDFFASPAVDVRRREDRIRAFLLMWNRSRRWWLSFAECVRLVVAKLGRLTPDECADWCDLVFAYLSEQDKNSDGMNDTVCRLSSLTSHEPNGDVREKGYGLASLRPADSDKAFSSSSPRVGSISLIEVEENDGLQLFPRGAAGRAEDFAAATSFVCGFESEVAHASAFVVRSTDNDSPVKLNLVRHFGKADSAQKNHSRWDSSSAMEIIAQIADNFYDLSALSIAPSAPIEGWSSKWPHHVCVVQDLDQLVSSLL